VVPACFGLGRALGEIDGGEDVAGGEPQYRCAAEDNLEIEGKSQAQQECGHEGGQQGTDVADHVAVGVVASPDGFGDQISLQRGPGRHADVGRQDPEGGQENHHAHPVLSRNQKRDNCQQCPSGTGRVPPDGGQNALVLHALGPQPCWNLEQVPDQVGKGGKHADLRGRGPNARAKRLKYGAAKFSAATAKPPSTVFSFMAFRVLGENMKAAKTSPPRRLIQLWI